MTGLTPSNKEYFPTVVINALLHILKDHSLVQWHGAVVDAIMTIFRTLGLECVPFLDRIVPAFLLPNIFDSMVAIPCIESRDQLWNQMRMFAGLLHGWQGRTRSLSLSRAR